MSGAVSGEVVELDSVCQFISGGTPSKERDDFWGGNIPWATARDLKSSSLSETGLTLTETGADTLRSAPAGAILILVRGMTLFKDVPITVLRRSMCFNQDIKALIPKDGYSGEYLAYQLAARKPEIHRLVDTAGHGTGRLDTDLLKQLPLRFPTLPEQEKIAGFLGAVDGKISGLRRKEEGLKRFKAGLMQKLFSQELRFTRDDGSDFPDWQEKRLEELAYRPGEQFDPQQESSRPRVIELEHLESGTGRILAAVEMDAQLSLKNRFRAGDVLFGKLRPYLRKFAHPDFDGVCSSEIWVLRSRGAVSAAFLYLLVQSERFMEAANMSSGSKMPRAEWKAVAGVEFPVPHPDEQRKIAEALSALDGKIAGVRAQVAGLETFKKGLLQQMFV